jgi:hypothetical protein
MIPKDFYRPNPSPDRHIQDRKAKFSELNDFVIERGGWLVSVPGDPEVRLETLPGSTLPSEIEKHFGYAVRETGQGERILAASIVERFTRRRDGELELLTPDSTAAVAETRTHAGIARVVKLAFDTP